jgi:hypothetical protein
VIVIAWAYGANFVHPLTGGCPDIVEQDLITGGPGWTRSDLWDIEAVIPAGSDVRKADFCILKDSSSSSTITVGAPPGRRKYHKQCSSIAFAIAIPVFLELLRYRESNPTSLTVVSRDV